MEVFRNLGIVDKFLEEAFHALTFNFYNEGQSVAQFSLDQLDSPYAAIFVLPQARTEVILGEYLANTYGIKVERNTELLDFENSQDKVTVNIRKITSNGREKMETMQVKYLIGCDGAHSTTRKKLGLQFEGLSIKNRWCFMDVELVTNLPTRHGFNILWKGGNALLLIPMGNNIYRILIDSDSSNRSHTDYSHEEYIEAATSLIAPYTFDVKKVAWFTNFQVNERKVKEYSQGRVFLCGDAAHIHSPGGGQGMNTGIQDAYNLVWKLALIERNHGDMSILTSSYTKERAPIAVDVLATSGTILRTFLSNASFLSSIRSQIVYTLSSFAFTRSTVAQKLVGFAIEYPQGPLTVPHGGWISQGPTSIKAGRRVPDITFSGWEGKNLHDFFSNPTAFHILVWVPPTNISKHTAYLEALQCSITKLRNAYEGATPFFETLVITDERYSDNKVSNSLLKRNFGSIYYANFDELQVKFGFTHNDPVILIVRPDGYLGLALYLRNSSQICEYFAPFMNN
ncbi:hypothetical protein K7432_016652 [Basidiobolus ranarum]|uniref:FAD-binding domain-containing protein n=1 Tax=Basidiobolus ranarum TaxID=34480 RepID=A0ABR2WEE8_9FUNG